MKTAGSKLMRVLRLNQNNHFVSVKPKLCADVSKYNHDCRPAAYVYKSNRADDLRSSHVQSGMLPALSSTILTWMPHHLEYHPTSDL